MAYDNTGGPRYGSGDYSSRSRPFSDNATWFGQHQDRDTSFSGNDRIDKWNSRRAGSDYANETMRQGYRYTADERAQSYRPQSWDAVTGADTSLSAGFNQNSSSSWWDDFNRLHPQADRRGDHNRWVNTVQQRWDTPGDMSSNFIDPSVQDDLATDANESNNVLDMNSPNLEHHRANARSHGARMQAQERADAQRTLVAQGSPIYAPFGGSRNQSRGTSQTQLDRYDDMARLAREAAPGAEVNQTNMMQPQQPQYTQQVQQPFQQNPTPAQTYSPTMDPGMLRYFLAPLAGQSPAPVAAATPGQPTTPAAPAATPGKPAAPVKRNPMSLEQQLASIPSGPLDKEATQRVNAATSTFNLNQQRQGSAYGRSVPNAGVPARASTAYKTGVASGQNIANNVNSSGTAQARTRPDDQNV